RHGIDPGDDVVTSAMAVAALVEPDEHVLVCGGPGLIDELRGRGAVVTDARDVVGVAGASPAAVVAATQDAGPFTAVVVGYHRDFDYLRMTTAMVAVR